jgi:hypothetical protein
VSGSKHDAHKKSEALQGNISNAHVPHMPVHCQYMPATSLQDKAKRALRLPYYFNDMSLLTDRKHLQRQVTQQQLAHVAAFLQLTYYNTSTTSRTRLLPGPQTTPTSLN